MEVCDHIAPRRGGERVEYTSDLRRARSARRAGLPKGLLLLFRCGRNGDLRFDAAVQTVSELLRWGNQKHLPATLDQTAVDQPTEHERI